MNNKQLIRLSKYGKSEDPQVETSTRTDLAGTELTKEGLSPWIGYTIDGYALTELREGETYMVDRIKRNGVEARGIFQTSPVIKVVSTPNSNEKIIHTQNSVYKLETI